MVNNNFNIDNIKNYNNLNFIDSETIGLVINDKNQIKTSDVLSAFSLMSHEDFDFYYISKDALPQVSDDLINDYFLLDVVIIYNDSLFDDLINTIISKCNLFGIPIIYIVDDVSIFDNFENNENYFKFISQNSDLIVCTDVLEDKFSDYNKSLQVINVEDENIQEVLLTILIMTKRDKWSKLYSLFKSFIALKEKNSKITFKDYIVQKSHEILVNSGLFNVNWYLSEYPDVKDSNILPMHHYLNFGVSENCNPSPDFITENYLKNHPNIDINPFVHYILYGGTNNFVSLNDTEKKIIADSFSYNSRIMINDELNYVKNNSNKLFFSDFEDFLAISYISPLISAPFTFEHKRCFSFMDHIAKYLINNKGFEFEPLVSVIIPVFNGKNVILNAVESVINQSYENIELIIVDDGSYDGTWELLNELEYDNVKLFRNDLNKGVANARNIGLKNANGEYIAYLDADNLWDSNYINAMVGAFYELPDADALFSGQILYENYDSNPSGVRFGVLNKSLLKNNSYIDLNSFCHKKEIIGKLGGFNEDLRCLEDWEFILRMISDFKLYSVPILLSKYYFNNSPNRISDTLNISKHPDFLINNDSIDNEIDIPLTRKVDIVIPSYEILDDLKECIESILNINENELINIIVVDNNSNSEVKSYLKSLEQDGKIRLILNDINYGFTYAVNQGISIADSDSDILLLNNDAILTKNSLGYMQCYAYKLDDCGIVVPQQILIAGGTHDIKAHVPYANPLFDCDANPSIAHKNIANLPLFHDGDILELTFAPFFCTYIKRETLDSSLWLDAELGRHYRSDRIFSNFVKFVLNQKMYHISKSKVFHKSQKATFTLKNNETDFNYIFSRNQWEPELAKKLGYKTAMWDI